jgi:hypothetical protein
LYEFIRLTLLYIGIYWKIPSPGGGGKGKYQLMSFVGINMKRGREKGGKCERK